ncbi:hypothetical protein [Agrobacterium sp. CG674]
MSQLAANVAEIAWLRAEREALCRLGVKLEEEITVAKLHLHRSYSRTGTKFVPIACRAKRSRLPIWTIALWKMQARSITPAMLGESPKADLGASCPSAAESGQLGFDQ